MRAHPVYTLSRSQWLPLGLPDTFAFFEKPDNLPLITPPWLALEVLTPGPIAMRRGLILDYRVRVLGLRTHWRSAITEYDPPHGFRDVQLVGPYRLWEHGHRFRTDDSGGTVVEDHVVYQLPGGPLGALVHRLVVHRQLEEIFAHRRRRIEALLVGGAERSE